MAKRPSREEIIWAPWRAGFVQGKPVKGCVFCKILNAADDTASWIVHRGKHNFVMLNRYPYTSGHLLVIPYRHIAALEKLRTAEGDEHFALTRRSAKALTSALRPDGINVGMNLGRSAGAGVESHIHTHLVPRWNGDNNFMPVIGGTRVLSVDLAPVYERLCAAFS